MEKILPEVKTKTPMPDVKPPKESFFPEFPELDIPCKCSATQFKEELEKLRERFDSKNKRGDE